MNRSDSQPLAPEPHTERLDSGLVRVFEDRAREAPNTPCIVVPEGRERARVELTYGDVHTCASQLASVIEARLGGAERLADEPIVALFMDRADQQMIPSQIACLAIGAPYLPLDPKQPDAYLETIATDASAHSVVTCAQHLERAIEIFGADRVVSPEQQGLTSTLPVSSTLARDVPGARLAYVIYTSGTTGVPKGVLIEQRSIANLIEDDRTVFGLGRGDRVAHGSSPSYDSALEEVWMALSTGATVVVIDDEALRAGPDLVALLAAERVTVLCPPPTLLRTLGDVEPSHDLPDLRWLYVGGEALPSDIARRFGGGSQGRAGPRLVNGYGPTEATVTALRSEVSRPDDVRIGRPVAGALAVVVDGAGEECPVGESGELWLGGAGVARGYLKRAELTALKFTATERWGRVYRTGDLARREADGDLVFLGRIDRQVQLRGHRVELEAVESALAAQRGIREAACLIEGEGARQVLVAWVVLTPGSSDVDTRDPSRKLARELPAVMVPAQVHVVGELPRTVGGKLDRKRLPQAANAAQRGGDAVASDPTPQQRQVTDLEAFTQSAVQAAMELGRVPDPDADLFEELGADSLAAAMIVSELRRSARGERVTVRDVYEAPSVAALALRLAETPSDERPATDHSQSQPASHPTTAPLRTRVAFTTAQVSWIAFELAITILAVRAVVFPALEFANERISMWVLLIAAAPLLLLARLALFPVALLWVRLVQRAILPRYTAGRFPAFGSFHLRHWIVTRAAAILPFELLRGTAAISIVLRALGARVGKGVHFHRGVQLGGGGWNLLEIGDGASFAQDAALRTVDLDGGELVVGPIQVGSGARLDVRASLAPGSSVGRNAELGPLSHLGQGQHVPNGESWSHTPARRTDDTVSRARSRRSVREQVELVLGGMCLTWLRTLVALGLCWLTFRWRGIELNAFVGSTLQSPAELASTVTLLAALACATVAIDLALVAVLTRGLGRLSAARSPAMTAAPSHTAWHATGLVHGAGRWLSGAMIWPSWLRLAGMRVGRGAEISTIIDTVPTGVSIGAEAFLADGVYLASASADVHGATDDSCTTVGQRSFVGNHAIIPPGRALPDDLLIGVSTVADKSVATPGAWFGQPAFELTRSASVSFDRSETHEPSAVRRLNRGFWEGLRIALPAGIVGLAFLWVRLLTYTSAAQPTLASLALASALVVAVALGGAIALKWLLLGRVSAGEHPLWSCWCSRWDFHYVAWGFFGRPVAAAFEGTLLLPFILRALGMRVGAGVLLGRGFSQVVDPDMLTFARGATVAGLFQAHTFEDRVLKIAPLTIGEGATLGSGALAFYGVTMESGARAEPGGVALKGERLIGGVSYEGAPLSPTRR